MQHTSSTCNSLRDLCSVPASASPASSAEPSAALEAPVSSLLHLSQSPSQSIPCTQAPAPHSRSCSKSPAQSAKLAKQSKQTEDISELKDQVAQVLEYLARQQAQTHALALAPLLAPAPELISPLPVVARDISEQDLAVAVEDQDTISNRGLWDGSYFPQDEEEGDVQELTFGTGPRSEATSDAGFSPLPSSIPAFTERASKFLQVPWAAVPEPCQSVFRM
ncbi:UNVERIFIED_CONTAM: hypothetical protein FKN15_008800 [Acipenser sinensis]